MTYEMSGMGAVSRFSTTVQNKVMITVAPCSGLPGLGSARAELIEWVPGSGPRTVAALNNLSCASGVTKTYTFNYRTRAGYRYQIYLWNLTHQTPEFPGGNIKVLNVRWDRGRLVAS